MSQERCSRADFLLGKGHQGRHKRRDEHRLEWKLHIKEWGTSQEGGANFAQQEQCQHWLLKMRQIKERETTVLEGCCSKQGLGKA